MLVDFTVVTRVASILGTWQNKELPNVFFSHNNKKRASEGMMHSRALWVGLPQ